MSFDVCKVDHYAWGAAFHSPVSWWQCEIAGMWCSGWDTKQNYNASTGLGQEKAGGQHVHKHLKDMQRHAIQLLPSKCIKLHGPIQCFCKRLWSMLPCILCMISSVVFSNFTVSLLLPSADTSYTHPMMLWNQGSVTETSVLFLQILGTGIWSCKITFWKSAEVSRDYWLFHFCSQTGGTIGILQRHLHCTHKGKI